MYTVYKYSKCKIYSESQKIMSVHKRLSVSPLETSVKPFSLWVFLLSELSAGLISAEMIARMTYPKIVPIKPILLHKNSFLKCNPHKWRCRTTYSHLVYCRLGLAPLPGLWLSLGGLRLHQNCDRGRCSSFEQLRPALALEPRLRRFR